MGKLVYHWDHLKHRALDNTPLRLTAISGVDQFSYLISDATLTPLSTKGFYADRKYLFFDKPLGYLNQLVSDDALLYEDFAQVSVAVRGVPFVALRPGEASQALIETRLQEVTDISKQDEIYSDITDEGIVVAFALPQAFARETHGWFSDATISHVMSSLMMCTIKHSRAMAEPVMLVNTSHTFCELIFCNQGQLVFANHYRVTGPEDVMYYVLAILQNLQMTGAEVVVKCAGPNAVHVLPVLQTYLPQIHFFSFGEINPGSDYPQVDTADLICVAKCAS